MRNSRLNTQIQLRVMEVGEERSKQKGSLDWRRHPGFQVPEVLQTNVKFYLLSLSQTLVHVSVLVQ